MTLQALLVSCDDAAADVLGRVLPALGFAMDRSSDPEATSTRIQQQKFDVIITDYDDPKTAADALSLVKQLGLNSLSVALVADAAKVREILNGGAQFVLHKPLSEDAIRAGLRPVAALLSRERRRAFRVPVQAPVEITLGEGRKLDGILLDLSETGMDVLTAEPQVAGSSLKFHLQLPGGALEFDAEGRVAWANPNGQTGVHFIDMPEPLVSQLRTWLQAAATSTAGNESDEVVPHCKLTDLSLGGCYVETDAPFPERALIDLCFKTGELEVHTEGMVRVVHPAHGMGVEFPSRTAEQRAQVENLINFLRSSRDTTPELMISPRALVADLTQFENGEPADASSELEDLLLELLRRGTALQQQEFLAELHHQRSPEEASV
jgi:CheY-like chemotaxis protein